MEGRTLRREARLKERQMLTYNSKSGPVNQWRIEEDEGSLGGLRGHMRREKVVGYPRLPPIKCPKESGIVCSLRLRSSGYQYASPWLSIIFTGTAGYLSSEISAVVSLSHVHGRSARYAAYRYTSQNAVFCWSWVRSPELLADTQTIQLRAKLVALKASF